MPVSISVGIVGLLLIFVGVWPLIPPPSASAGADLTEFSATRAFEHVEQIAVSPHPMGSDTLPKVRGYIVEQLAGMGLPPELQTSEAPDYFGQPGRTVPVVNVMARLEGSGSTAAIVLIAHYDTDPSTPGANDNSAAVATVLESVRALTAGSVLDNDVILLFTDGEEPAPRFGSSAFVEGHPWMSDVGLVFNFEAIGGSGPSLLIDVSGPDRSMIDQYISAVPHPAAFSFVTELSRLIGGSVTDFSEFRDVGVAGFDFAYMHGSPIYHTAADNVDSVGLRSLQHHGSNALALTKHFGAMDLNESTDDSGVVFFTVGGFWVVRYSSALAAALAVVVVFGLAGLVYERRTVGSLRRLLSGAWTVFLAVFAGSVVVSFIWWGLTILRNTPAIWESYLYLAVLLSVGVLVFVALVRRAERRSERDLAGGTLLVWAVFAALTGFALPGASYLFIWPALTGVLVAGAGSVPGKGLNRFVGGLAVALPAAVVMIPAMDFFFQVAQPRPGNPGSQLVYLVGLTAFFGLLVVALLRPFWTPPRFWGSSTTH
ncbi:MAG: M28 family peptidase [Acidimicrobiia bacterium]